MNEPFGSQPGDWVLAGILFGLMVLVVYLVVYLHRIVNSYDRKQDRMIELLEAIERLLERPDDGSEK